MRKVTIENPIDHTAIPALVWDGSSEASQNVHVLLHGLGTSKREFADFYVRLAEKLRLHGHSSVSIDFRYHGDSKAAENEFTVMNCVSDGLSALRWCARMFPNARLSVFGTSFGGSIAVILASLYKDLDHLDLLAPVLDYQRLYIEPKDPARQKRYGGLLDTAIRDIQPFPATDELSFHPRMVMELASISVPELAGRLAIPVNIMHGTSDSLVPIAETKRVLRRFRSRSFYSFRGMEHGFAQAGDEEGMNPASLRNLERIALAASGARR